MSGFFRIAFTSRFSLSTIAFGVPAGAITPSQLDDSSPGMPASALVGTLGNAGLRRGPSTAIALTEPAFTCCEIPGTSWNID